MKRKVKIISSLVITFALLLAACSPAAPAPGGAPPAQAPAPAGTPAAPAPAAAAADEPVTLEFFLLKSIALGVHEEMQELFQQENPHITVNFVAIPDPQTALFARIAAGDIPDMLNTWPTMLTYRIMMDDGLFVELSDQPWMNRIPDHILELSVHNGRHYSVPVGMSAYGVWYNQDIFAEHGISSNPTTWEELLAIAQTLQDAGVTPFALYGRAPAPIGQMMERFIGILENDSDTFFRNIVQGTEDIWARPDVRLVGEMMLDIANFSQLDVMGFDQDQAQAEFLTERAAMIIGGTWFDAAFMAAGIDFNYSIFPLPNPLGPFGLPFSVDTAWSVASTAVCVDSGLKKLEFLTRPEISQMYADVEGSPNVVYGVVYKNEALERINAYMNDPELNVFLTPVNHWPPGFRARWQEYGQLVLMDGNVDNFVENTLRVLHEFYE